MAITGRERGPQPAVMNDRRLSDFRPPQLSVLQPPLTTPNAIRRCVLPVPHAPAKIRLSAASATRRGPTGPASRLGLLPWPGLFGFYPARKTAALTNGPPAGVSQVRGGGNARLSEGHIP